MRPMSTDVVVVGAGPIGIELARAFKNEEIDYIQFDKGQIAQTISWFPSFMRFFSSADRIAIPGIPIPRVDQSKCTKEEYLAYLRSVVQQFGLAIRTYESVDSIEKNNDNSFLLKTTRKKKKYRYRAKKVVLVIGDMHEPRLLNIPGENLPHVSHFFDDPHTYFKQRILVVGGKNSAVEAALRCYHCGASVTLSYRGREFNQKHVKYWLLPELESLIRQKKITLLKETIPVEIRDETVTLKSLKSGRTKSTTADFVLLLTGYKADMHLFRKAGAKLKNTWDVPKFNRRTMETSVPGLYVAGTAAAGTQKSYRLFIENCHIHVDRIVASLMGETPPKTPKFRTDLES